MPKRNLVLIHRGSRYVQDFKEIAQKVSDLDKDISVYLIAFTAAPQLPAAMWFWPSLCISFSARFRIQVRRGPILRNRQVEKLEQYRIFRETGIPSPPMASFKFGMRLDPLLFGEFVIIKPMDLRLTSRGAGVQLFRRQRLEQITPADFPPEHPIHKDRGGYLVQRFIDTGVYPSFHRVQTFFGKALYSWHSTLTIPRCPLDAPDAELERTVIASQGGAKERELVKNKAILELAGKVHSGFPSIPLLAIDVIREESTGQLYVLECNPGGNTWHFSSKIGEKLRLGFGNAEVNGEERANQIARKMFMEQYGAFDIVAKTLVAKTRALAS